MEIVRSNEYNQSIGKYKLLSSTAGVGSIITTQIGYYILVSDINKWKFVKKAQSIVEDIRAETADDKVRYDLAKKRIGQRGIYFVDDKRFRDFLRTEKELAELICLIGIPDIALNEHFNSPNWKDHPINQLLKKKGEDAKAEEYMVLGTHFPKWFKNADGLLKTYSEWKSLWNNSGHQSIYFVPPRDANKRIVANTVPLVKRLKDADGVSYTIDLYQELSQTNLVLICPNGHLSDIPWPKFLRWRTELFIGVRDRNTDKGEALFNELECETCCPQPQLKWTESKTKSEGYGSIYIECMNCGLGSGGTNQPKINLEGINNLKPLCPGHRPWEVETSGDNDSIPRELCVGYNTIAGSQHMQIALVTGNNIYYANGFSSVYIPENLAKNKDPLLLEAKDIAERMMIFFKGRTRQQFCEDQINIHFLTNNNIIVNDPKLFLFALKNEIIGVDEEIVAIDPYEQYRFEEYQCFINNSKIEVKNGLKFADILLPIGLNRFFTKIQQIEELRITQVQLDFNRVKPKERIKIDDEIVVSATGQNIYSLTDQELFVLPANESFGEGIFFQFNDVELQDWASKFMLRDDPKYNHFFFDHDLKAQGAAFKQKIKNNGLKHFIIHSFAHILMRELEFSCGYPTASLKERLYISDRMSGVLIYTAEGSEGSMGGLVWQGSPLQIEKLIKKGLSRAWDCSSDPLCWESEGQGLFGLNLAACFSCSLVSETACEEMNLGLDRSILVDHNHGFFKDLLN
ncbi:MAG: DUF1998 domain-containing protein [Pedobacter sp.]